MLTQQQVKWTMEADYLQACNCDYGCPCEFDAPPTQGFCEGVGAWRINRGRYGDVALDGLGLEFRLALPASWLPFPHKSLNNRPKTCEFLIC